MNIFSFSNLQDFIREVKFSIQRIKRGYSDKDVWSVDFFLTDILPKMLKQLKETTHGYPGDLTEEKWNNILDKMIMGFEAAHRLQDGSNWVMNDGDEIKSVPCEDNKNFSRIEFTNPWTDEQRKHFRKLDEKDNQTFNEGMDLFKEFFFSLWD